MISFDWEAIYLTCFGVGLVLSVLAFLSGFGHLHFGHVRMHMGHHHVGARGGVRAGAGRSNALVLLCSLLSGLAGASVVFWFLSRVLLAREKTLEPADTDIVGMVGKLSGGIPKGGVGEMLYSQNGARWSAVVRTEDGEAIERGAEVIVMRRTKGIAYVRRWDEFAHGLLGSEPARNAEE